MKKLNLLLIIILTFSSSYSQIDENKEEIIFTRIGELSKQQLENSGPSKLNSAKESEVRKLAEKDIKNGNPFLLLRGGIAPSLIATDPQFEKKYNLYFYEYGCGGPEQEIIKKYNYFIFEYLTKRYGEKWIQEVRNDVIGLDDYKNKVKE